MQTNSSNRAKPATPKRTLPGASSRQPTRPKSSSPTTNSIPSNVTEPGFTVAGNMVPAALPNRRTNDVRVPDGYLAVGHIVGVHGLNGEVKVELYTDFPERFDEGVRLFLGERLAKVRIQSVRPHKLHLLIKFHGTDRREHAEMLRNQWLFIAEDQAFALEEDIYWEHQIIGLTAKSDEGRLLGVVKEILHTGANDVYVIDMAGKELLVPAISQVVQTVDLETKELILHLLPGMLND